MCFDKLRRFWRNYKKHLAGHYFQCRSKKLFSEGMRKVVITRYNGLQYVTRYYKNNPAQGLVWKSPKKSFFLKEVISCYNVLQQVTKNRHEHCFQCCPGNLFFEGKGKAVITRDNNLQCVTRSYKNNAA